VIFLGTGAAELYPNPFCKCETCERARAIGDVPRKRSALLLDEKTCMDFGPEVLAASQQYNAPFYDLTDIFITHTHGDHLCISNLEVLTMTPRNDRHIRLWLSPKGVEWLNDYIESNNHLYRDKRGLRMLLDNGWLSINAIEPYKWHEIGDRRVFAVESNHQGKREGEFALNYIIESNGRRVMYATDTGLYSEANLETLRGFACDVLIMEGTNGSLSHPRSVSHLTGEFFIENVENFDKYGVIKPEAEVYVTHINQVNKFSHAEYQAYLDEHSAHKITVAYDGMKV